MVLKLDKNTLAQTIYLPEQRAAAVGELPWALQGAKEVSSRSDSYFRSSRSCQCLVIWDLAPFLVPEGLREIHGLWAPSAMPGDREWGLTRDIRGGSGDMSSPLGWNAVGDKQQNGKERDGSKIPAAIRAANGDGMKWESSLGRESEAKGPCKMHSAAEDLAENLSCQLVMPGV